MEAIVTESQLKLLTLKTITENQKIEEFQNKFETMSDESKKIFFELVEIFYPEAKGNINEVKWYNYVGDILGFVPGIGTPIDIANGLSYISQGDYFFGLLSMISAIDIVGDAVAKPLLVMGKGSKTIKAVDNAMKLAKIAKETGDVKKAAEASKILADMGKTDSLVTKLLSSVKSWVPKIIDVIERFPMGKLGKGLKTTIVDWLKLFQTAGKGAAEATKVAGKFSKLAKTSRTPEEIIKTAESMKNLIKADKKLFSSMGPGITKDWWKGFKDYKMSGLIPRLFANRATTSLMRRTKFWAGFLDYLGVANFVGPDELKAKMGNFDEKMNEYSKTQQAKQNWDDDFNTGNQSGDEDILNQKMGDETQSTSGEKSQGDFTKNLLNNLVFGPITGQATA
jgi:hypothetical protein